ncbi:uncharacterized protein EV420DRAFT_1633840 [Desarmillaria tabescens]|uniref:Uncharacterized protein n=1 Tax=Armillaria tabescens TaxID=1929756 RepID=A0AA39NPG2_ARMTA|nr:uncharacterized protein EV420DRAFT_1633840 [Desarmillaria tabescens]KAK0469427.1 hypothetical protein EV420DRAFT_1633840 [Desarmillaria tabescens]
MNAFISHFCDLDVLRISWPGMPIGPRTFFETRRVTGHPPLPRPISDRQKALKGTLPSFKKVYIRNATGSNTFEWFNNQAAWYDPTAVCSLQYHAEVANVTGLDAFLELCSNSLNKVVIRTMETIRPYVFPRMANLSTLSLTTDITNMEQTYHSLQSLSSRSSIYTLTITVRGSRVCPCLQDFALVYEAGAYNQLDFARLTWIVSTLMRNTPVILFMQHHLVKENANLVFNQFNSEAGETTVTGLDQGSEDRLVNTALGFQTFYDMWTCVSL